MLCKKDKDYIVKTTNGATFKSETNREDTKKRVRNKSRNGHENVTKIFGKNISLIPWKPSTF